MPGKRIYLKTLADQLYQNEELFDVMKKLCKQDVLTVLEAFMEASIENIDNDVTVIFRNFGSFSKVYPKVKKKKNFDVFVGDVVEHIMHPKVKFKPYFKLSDDESK